MISAEPQTPASETHVSLAFNSLFHQLRPERRYHVLDLGPAIGGNVDFFSQFSCKLYIEDLYRTLVSFDFFSPEEGSSYEEVVEYLLPFPRDTEFDVVLSWDLFNYLEPVELRHLVGHLTKFCRRGALWFAMIATQKHIPEKPLQFRIVNEEKLRYEVGSRVLRESPRYQQSDLLHIMPRFRVANSFLLRNGFKEYLLTRE